MFFRMVLSRFPGMMLRPQVMPVSDVRMMAGRFMLSLLVALGGFLMMFRGVLMMLCGFLMMFRTFVFSHRCEFSIFGVGSARSAAPQGRLMQGCCPMPSFRLRSSDQSAANISVVPLMLAPSGPCL
jgi:hypothetical protein